MNNALNWFEIPASDFDRAVRFYSSVVNSPLKTEDMGPMKMGIFPSEGDTAVSGAVVLGEFHKPSSSGTLVYLNANSGMPAMLERIQQAGGTVLLPRTLINENIGYMAIFSDSEGNTVALHSEN